MPAPKERDADSPYSFLQKIIAFPGKMYEIVRTEGLFHPWFHPWFLASLCSYSNHTPLVGLPGQKWYPCVSDWFCPGVHQIALCMHVSTPNDYNWKYFIFLHNICLSSICFESVICKQWGIIFDLWTSAALPPHSWQQAALNHAIWVALKMKLWTM